MAFELRPLDLRQPLHRGATISKCGQYRYDLSRKWVGAGGPFITFVMLNPSTADGKQDDPTIRRCMRFARDHGNNVMTVINLYAGRATKPADLFKMDDPVGPAQRQYWWIAKELGTVVCAWGSNKNATAQAASFVEFMGNTPLYCLGTTKTGAPRHPLYVPASQRIVPWEPA